MSFAIFIVLVLGLFVAVLNWLPVAPLTLPFGFANSLVLIVGYMKAWDFFLPISELFIAVKIVLVYELTVWAWHVIVKVTKFIRGHSDGS